MKKRRKGDGRGGGEERNIERDIVFFVRPGGEIKIFLHKCIPPSTSSFLGPVAQWKLIRLIELIAFNLWPNCLWNWPLKHIVLKWPCCIDKN